MGLETQTQGDAQALWNELATEREAGDAPPSEQGFKQETTEPVETEVVTAAEPKADEAPKPEAEAETPDPFAGLSPEVRAKLEQVDKLQQQLAVIPQLQQGLSTAVGRVASMQRALDASRQAAQQVKEAPSQAQITAASKSVEKWDDLKKDFPEWADATEAYVTAKLAGLQPQQAQQIDPRQLEALVNQRVESARRDMTRQLEEARVEAKHDDWLDVIQGQEFEGWLTKQTPEVQQLVHSPKAKDAIRVIDLFKGAKAAPAEQVQQSRQQRLAAAVTTKPAQAPVRKTVDQMSPQELWNYEAERARKKAPTHGLTY